MGEKNQIRLGVILSYLSIAINILAGLLYTPWMVQQIGKNNYGLYTLANSLIVLFMVDFGLSAATSRFVSKYIAEGRQDKVDDFLGIVYKLYLIIDAVILIVFIVIFFFIDSIYVNLTPDEIEKFKVIYCIAAINSVISFPFVTLNGILTSYEKFIQQKLADIIHRVLTMFLTISALCLGMGLYALVTVNAISGLVTIAYKLIAIKKTTAAKVNFKYSDKKLYKSIFMFSFWSTVSSVAQRLIFNITPTILGIVANSAAIAVFGVVTTIEQYSYLITSAINGMFMPKISQIYYNNKDADIMPLMIKVGRFQFAINGLIVAGFATVGKSFINLWMGKDFSDAYIGIMLVILPGLFYNPLQIANTAMIVKNKVKLQAVITLITGLTNIICSFLLSRSFGAVGACISIFIAYSIRAVLYHIIHKRVMKTNIPMFMKKCYLKMLPTVLITLLFGVGLNIFVEDGGWLILAIKVSILVFVYFVGLLILGLTKEERTKLFNKIRSIS